ncbi:hypothetical protein, partial [Enterobacter cloacae complex sp. CH23B]|uniref:hypothetical protein n=1 Tax=Enterobacter cloacae complex sp. CH23B TaxID=2511986 RepID=UPI001027CC11
EAEEPREYVIIDIPEESTKVVSKKSTPKKVQMKVDEGEKLPSSTANLQQTQYQKKNRDKEED